MDIARPSNRGKQRVRRAVYSALAVGLVGLTTVGLSLLKPAAATVARTTIWIDTVKRGPLVREVRGIGSLVPEDLRWIPATTEGRVDRILLRPGTAVQPDSVVLELVNPQLDQELENATLSLRAEEASLQQLRVQVQGEALQQQAAAAAIEADYAKARMQAEMNEALAAKQLVSALALRQSQIDAEQHAMRREIAARQVSGQEESHRARLAVQQSRVDQARAVLQLKARQRGELSVRAGVAGVLQVVPVDVGQQVGPGANLARVAGPGRLKAEIRIAETQARDVQVGQRARVDTRNGVVDGTVARIDPSVQNGTRTIDVTLTGELPRGSVPDLSVEGIVEIERLPDVVYMGRPALGQEQSAVTLFVVREDGSASRVPVKLGRSSINVVEVLSGVDVGDQVVLSDMTAWDAVDRIRLR
jgi:HlyD family secretion protein